VATKTTVWCVNERCPKCHATMLSNGHNVWCSFVGWRESPACDYGIVHLVTVEDFAKVKLLLELSQTAKTERILLLEDVLRSARTIAQRKGENTAWETFDAKIQSLGVGSVTAKVFMVPVEDPNQCETCGIGYRLPSGVCDHCNTKF